MLLMIDNYDSFTYTIVQYFRELGETVSVVKNDQCGIAELIAMKPDRLVISPGPCTPNESGISIPALSHFAGQIPILGICLGHQCIGQHFGARIVKARQIMHGKVSRIFHRRTGLFSELENGFQATRYHSLVIAPDSLPECLEMTAWTRDQNDQIEEIMGITHKSHAIVGVQFHPESVLTQSGHALLANFLKIHENKQLKSSAL
ncbi:anthranilate synthase component II [Gynuella sunshinyii]|uniref:Anthranilate/para-aminobenzoate synthase component II n=1 Tax=Gynuella sunshinyii YC6258 TaxID=1445510 RepID=A0A0C5VP04_9GAMM|nr:aminodeoxychorismate/anthranilate synthase component II [Gynuella sunshinyii]AJQ96397.1 anthranilate/para-aminobenzoate synthase component II [Gynuella sunshinyii YC6258]